MTRIIILITLVLMTGFCTKSWAITGYRIEQPPLAETWFGIYVDKERVGFYRQKISPAGDGYRIEGDGSVVMKVMGFSKEASSHEEYLVSKTLVLRSFNVEQTINGSLSHVRGNVGEGSIRLKSETDGKTTEKQLKFKGEVYPGPALNLYPLMRDRSAGKSYRVMTFDPEELKVKEVKISVLGEEATPDGKPALKLRNNLYPFVTNDIWVDSMGNTLLESVRDGLVTTAAENPAQLGSFVGNIALSKKDLIYDFSLVRAEPPLKETRKLSGLSVELSGWNDALPLLQGGGQLSEKTGDGRIVIRNGSFVTYPPDYKDIKPSDDMLKPADKIESDAPEIVAQAKVLAQGAKNQDELARALASWTSDWLRDTVDDGGSAVASFKSRTGNCQTHARLYIALARAVEIPSRFVSGLVYQPDKGFLYHSWAESYINQRWVPVDPTYNQLPADPTHLKLLQGHLPEDMAPIITIIGRIKIKVLDTKPL